MKYANCLLASILLAVSSFPAFGQNLKSEDWIYIGKNETGEAYFSPTSVRHENGFVLVRTVMNVGDGTTLTGEKEDFKSFIAIFTIDCKAWTFLMGPVFQYMEQFALGALTGNSALNNRMPDTFKSIDPQHLLHKMALRLCK